MSRRVARPAGSPCDGCGLVTENCRGETSGRKNGTAGSLPDGAAAPVPPPPAGWALPAAEALSAEGPSGRSSSKTSKRCLPDKEGVAQAYTDACRPFKCTQRACKWHAKGMQRVRAAGVRRARGKLLGVDLVRVVAVDEAEDRVEALEVLAAQVGRQPEQHAHVAPRPLVAQRVDELVARDLAVVVLVDQREDLHNLRLEVGVLPPRRLPPRRLGHGARAARRQLRLRLRAEDLGADAVLGALEGGAEGVEGEVLPLGRAGHLVDPLDRATRLLVAQEDVAPRHGYRELVRLDVAVAVLVEPLERLARAALLHRLLQDRVDLAVLEVHHRLGGVDELGLPLLPLLGVGHRPARLPEEVQLLLLALALAREDRREQLAQLDHARVVVVDCVEERVRRRLGQLHEAGDGALELGDAERAVEVVVAHGEELDERRRRPLREEELQLLERILGELAGVLAVARHPGDALAGNGTLALAVCQSWDRDALPRVVLRDHHAGGRRRAGREHLLG